MNSLIEPFRCKPYCLALCLCCKLDTLQGTLLANLDEPAIGKSVLRALHRYEYRLTSPLSLDDWLRGLNIPPTFDYQYIRHHSRTYFRSLLISSQYRITQCPSNYIPWCCHTMGERILGQDENRDKRWHLSP